MFIFTTLEWHKLCLDSEFRNFILEDLSKAQYRADSILGKLDKIGKDKVLEELYSNELLQEHLFAGGAGKNLLAEFLNIKPYTLSEAETVEQSGLNPSYYLKAIIQILTTHW